ncbi:putative DNA mismatch repair protein [Talaromyces proteolyticus]|uniref:DNA mismatch repair protein n=1 Tax=Talaromyces proteolyticus TaxID=1131652 RepID=A0AAD4KH95_9EURO|nr:putative DNA mismatch repair protein [Talaromyces proteolyticus]KAH8692119.1 putative DNA mismatch repair protein [Talaromyces proteolyticus]
MPIAALPPATAQAIGSTSVLSDPCAVVKELLDNGLDASASSISVEISQNTIDTIQVKDNGHGIAPEDFACVCKRAYTSKIQTLDDFRNVGGQSLGFRGEALASAAEMADTLTVTTRTKDEVVGSALKYNRKGDLISSDKTSHPIGTTVCLVGFLKSIPVRRQTAVKNAAKTITKIKKLLQAYAIARPSTRISFKVLKSKNEKDNWTYAPSASSNLADAIRKAIGVEVASQCLTKSWPDQNYEADAVRLVAVLPKSDADFPKVGNSGQYLCVDGRPLSSSRGTLKEIVRLFKSYVRSAARTSGHSTLSDPFLCLQMTCPKGSYDANVEPGKDDVLFAEQQEIVALSESLFKQVYGEVEKGLENTDEAVLPANDFTVLMRRPAIQAPLSPPTTNPQHSAPGANSWTAVTPQQDVYSPSHEAGGASETERDAGIADRNTTNPWSIARTHFFHQSSSPKRPSQLLTPIRRDSSRGANTINIKASQSSPSDVSSPASHASSPQQRRGSGSRFGSASVEGPPRLHIYSKASRERDRERYGNGSLDTWFTKQNQPVLSTSTRDQSHDQDGAESVMLDDLDADDVFETRTKLINKAFKPPVPSGGRSSRAPELFSSQISTPDDGLADIERRDKQQEFPVMEDWSSRLHQPSPVIDHTQSQISDSQETEYALDFERRKREANLARRRQLQSGQLSLTTPASSQSVSKSPHQNRYLAARAALSTSTQGQADLLPVDEPSLQTNEPQMSDSDPRAYLMRELERTTSGETTKKKRAFTNRLPLERIPNGFDSHELSLELSLPSSITAFAKECKPVMTIDEYAISGKEYRPFSRPDNQGLAEICKTWEATLSSLVKSKYRLRDVDLYGSDDGSEDARLEGIDIYAAIQRLL